MARLGGKLLAVIVFTGLTALGATTIPDFSGKWVCMHGKQKIPGAMTQRGQQVDGYCIYPDGKRASFKGTVSGNTLTGTLSVDKNTTRTVTGTLTGDILKGSWSSGSRGGPWTATRSDSR